MLDNKGFDLWADGYDKTVGVSARLQRSCMKTAVRSMARIFQHG